MDVYTYLSEEDVKLIAESDTEHLKRLMQKVVLDTKDRPMADVMRTLLDNGGREILSEDPEFSKKLIQNILTHENQYVVIYENYEMAARFFDLYHLLVD